MDKSNLAYISRYENAAEKPRKQAESEKKNISVAKAKAESRGSAAKVFFMAIAAALLLTLVVYGKMQNAAIYNEISEESRYVDTLRSENVRMQTAIESKSGLKAVEDYAENILGMQKLDKSQIEYLSLENGNVAELPQQDSNVFVKIKHAFEDFVEYLRG